MTQIPVSLGQRLKQLGFTPESWVKLYGEEFELLSDPIVMGNGAIVVEAIEKRSKQLRHLRIPLTIINMANERRAA
jgi:hypothetical protein